jgi:hypothetical protein
MKEIWEQVIKAIPPEAMPALLLVTCAFFGIYYAKGLRSYADAVNDKWFLTATIVIAAGFLIYLVNRTEFPQVEKDTKVALLVPRFDNDENRQFENLFSQQVQAAVHTLVAQATVVQFDGYVRDRSEANILGKALKATAVIFQPKVVRANDKTFICFSLFIAGTEATKPYPPLPAEIEKATLDDLSSSIIGLQVPLEASETASVSTRLNVLEKQVAALDSAIHHITPGAITSITRTYVHRRAIVVGVNRVATKSIPQLTSAVSDASSFAEMLKSSAYEVTILLDDGATSASLREALAKVSAVARPEDLTAFYYAGSSFSSKNFTSVLSAADLVLTTFDVTLDAPHSNNATLSQLVRAMRGIPGDKLIILDGCHGTDGLPESPHEADSTSTENFQVMAGSQDNEMALEFPGGGVFTQALLKELRKYAGQAEGISTSALIARISGEVAMASQGMQHPKFVTVSGHNDIVLALRPK